MLHCACGMMRSALNYARDRPDFQQLLSGTEQIGPKK